MSLSTLQVQLAALNNRSSQAGLSIASNRQHGDRMGRGISYSVQQGHSVVAHTNLKHRPTLLYETTTAAADIPLATLQQQCISAIQQFISWHVYPRTWTNIYEVLFSVTDHTHAETLASSIRRVLWVLSCILAECETDQSHTYYTPSLHIFEYLLRKYDVHVHYSVELLWCLLPVAKQFPKLMHRCFLLCDWTAIHQSYLWLRPYCVETTDTLPKMPSPQLLSISTMKHVDILRTICHTMLPAMAQINHQEVEHSSKDRILYDPEDIVLASSLRMGMSRILSFTAAIIVGGLAWLQQHRADNTDKEEAVLRILLPTVGRFIERQFGSSDYSPCYPEEFVGWGYIIASTMVETIPVSTEVIDVLCVKIIRSIAGNPVTYPNEDSTNASTEASVNAISCVVSILFVNDNSTMPEQDDQPSFIPLHQSPQTWLGCCKLSSKIYDALVEYLHDTLPNLFAWLLVDPDNQEHGNSKMVAAIASLIAALMAQFAADTKLVGDRAEHSSHLMVSLISNTQLRRVWIDPRFDLVASVMSFLLDRHMNTIAGSKYRSILLELHKLDSVAAERGIAASLQNNESSKSMTPTGSTLESILAFCNDILRMEGNENVLSSGISDINCTLPYRVALEHTDPNVRLRAVQSLVALSAGGEANHVKNIDSELGSPLLLELLLRQMIHDFSDEVKNTIGAALTKWFEQGNSVTAINMENASRTMNLALEAFYRLYGSVPPHEASFIHCISLLGYVAREVARLGEDDIILLWQAAVEGLVAIMRSDMNSKITESAASALIVAFDQEMPLMSSKADAVVIGVKSMLRECAPFIHRLNRARKVKSQGMLSLGIDGTDAVLHKKCVLLMLEIFLEFFQDKNTICDLNLRKVYANDALSLCLYYIESLSRSDVLAAKESDILVTTLTKSWAMVRSDVSEQIPTILIRIVSTESDPIWSSMSGPMLQSLLYDLRNQHGHIISPFMVLFEAAVRVHHSNGTTIAVKRLIRQARDMLSVHDSEGKNAPWLAFVPALSLLDSKDRTIRIAAADFLREMEYCLKRIVPLEGKETSTKCYFSLIEVCRRIPHAKSSAKLDEHNFLATFLASCVRESSEPGILRETLLSLCLYSALSCCCGFSVNFTTIPMFRWLPFRCNVGGCNASATVLDAVELAGEEAFPLVVRWKYVGSKLLDMFLTFDADFKSSLGTLNQCYEPVVKTVCLMLKGICISDPVLIVSTGPRSTGQGGSGRTRSYSLGKMDGISVLTPYPKDMVKALIRILSEAGRNRNATIFAGFVIRNILSSTTWGECVFKTLSRRNRVDLATAIIDFIKNESTEGMDGFPVGAPLSAGDIVEILFNSGTVFEPQCVAILMDFVRSSFEELSNDKSIAQLVSGFFTLLRSVITNTPSKDVEDDDFMIQDILLALITLVQHSIGNPPFKVSAVTLKDWNAVLLRLLGCEIQSTKKPILTLRSRSAALTLLVTLCHQYPDHFVESLIQASIASVTNCSNHQSVEKIASITLSRTVPCFVRSAASCGLSLTDFLYQFVSAAGNLDAGYKSRISGELARVLANCTSAGLEAPTNVIHGCVGALQAIFLAYDVFQNSKSKNGVFFIAGSVDFVNRLLDHCSAVEQLTSLLLLLHYITELLSQFQNGRQHLIVNNMNDLLPTSLHIRHLAATGSCVIKLDEDIAQSDSTKSALNQESCCSVIMAMLRALCDGLAIDSIHEYIRLGDGEASKLSLRLWQNLLLLQALSHLPVNAKSNDSHAHFQDFVNNVASESLESIQGVLPSHVFLASVTALIKDEDNAEIRYQALRLVANRVQHVVPESPEALLFVDILPIILEVTCAAKIYERLTKDDVILIQSAIYAIEHISRLLGLPRSSDGVKKKSSIYGMNHFNDALQHCSRILLEFNALQSDESNLPDFLLDLICTTALCCATLIRIVGALGLAILPKLMGALIGLLKSSNSSIVSRSLANNSNPVHHRMVQLSIVRCLLAVTETVPQFLPPFLPDLFTGSGILSKSLRVKFEGGASMIPIEEAVENVCTALSSNVATRLLVPSASHALQKCTHCDEFLVLMNILQKSISDASSSSVVSQKEFLLSAVTTVLEYDGVWEEQSSLILASCSLLVSMVLKLSEPQLQQTYESLRDWRGCISPTDPKLNAVRRCGFWTLSARLSHELHSLFFPCLDIVLDDVAAELNVAVEMLQSGGAAMKSSTSGMKKQKLGKHLDYGIESMRIIYPLLSLLESSLRADARQGGKWIRGDSQKFECLLEPLGKMFFSHIPASFPVPDHVTDKYIYIIEGIPDDIGGSVIGCLSALAMAGGNEQLWKPLNHVVMQACGEEHRSDVRHAGLVCLLELMKSLGEEYMVLLPENLPIISELLEDSNEGVADLAREVVTQAEELLGESLEDSLR